MFCGLISSPIAGTSSMLLGTVDELRNRFGRVAPIYMLGINLAKRCNARQLSLLFEKKLLFCLSDLLRGFRHIWSHELRLSIFLIRWRCATFNWPRLLIAEILFWFLLLYFFGFLMFQNPIITFSGLHLLRFCLVFWIHYLI